MELEFETYTPSEAEPITDVVQATVRNWRRSGHLPSRKGHARYNLPDLLVMFSIGMLVSRGTTPEAAKEVSGLVARAIFQRCLWNPMAYSEEISDTARKKVGEIPQDEIARFKNEAGGDFDLKVLEDIHCQKVMIYAAEQLAGVAKMKHPSWLVVFADGSVEPFYDEEDLWNRYFSEIQFGDAAVQGPVTLFCLGALAKKIIDRLPRPAFRLKRG